jgi:hypothetical protein
MLAALSSNLVSMETDQNLYEIVLAPTGPFNPFYMDRPCYKWFLLETGPSSFEFYYVGLDLVKRLKDLSSDINYLANIKPPYKPQKATRRQLWMSIKHRTDSLSRHYSSNESAKKIIQVYTRNENNDNIFHTLMMLPAGYNFLDNFKIILKNLMLLGVDINHQNNQGKTPLHIAISREEFNRAKVCIELGADLLIKDNNNINSITLLENMRKLTTKWHYHQRCYDTAISTAIQAFSSQATLYSGLDELLLRSDFPTQGDLMEILNSIDDDLRPWADQ